MSKVIEQLSRSQLTVARTGSFDLERADAELQRLSKAGSVLPLTKGFYALIPEHYRGRETSWRPTIEGAALGMAACLYSPDIRNHISSHLRREFPNLEWTPLGSHHQVETWILTSGQLDIKSSLQSGVSVGKTQSRRPELGLASATLTCQKLWS